MMSLPAPPFTVSLPPRVEMTSGNGEPTRLSGPVVPTTVGKRPPQVCGSITVSWGWLRSGVDGDVKGVTGEPQGGTISRRLLFVFVLRIDPSGRRLTATLSSTSANRV